jgi:hypothetical protein
MTDVDLYRQFSSAGAELQSTFDLMFDAVLALAEATGTDDPQMRAKLSASGWS